MSNVQNVEYSKYINGRAPLLGDCDVTECFWKFKFDILNHYAFSLDLNLQHLKVVYLKPFC